MKYSATSFCRALCERGTQPSSRYSGAMFFGDWARSWIRVAYAKPGSTEPSGEVGPFATNAGGPVRFRFRDGALYYLALNAGEVRRITYANG